MDTHDLNTNLKDSMLRLDALGIDAPLCLAQVVWVWSSDQVEDFRKKGIKARLYLDMLADVDFSQTQPRTFGQEPVSYDSPSHRKALNDAVHILSQFVIGRSDEAALDFLVTLTSHWVQTCNGAILQKYFPDTSDEEIQRQLLQMIYYNLVDLS